MVDERAVMAARNNADWYTTLFEVHGRRYERRRGAFIAVDDPPPFHSWVTTTAPDLDAEVASLVEEMSKRHDVVVKDSFCSLDVVALRLHPFIEASWIHGRDLCQADVSQWRRVETSAELARWERAWSDGAASTADPQFPARLLERHEVAFWARVHDGVIDAGVIAHRSDDCVGMSNVFGHDATFAAASLCRAFGDGLPVVGYEWADALDQAEAAGFCAVGPLRICARR